MEHKQANIDRLKHQLVTVRRHLRSGRAEKAKLAVDVAAGLAEEVGEELRKALSDVDFLQNDFVRMTAKAAVLEADANYVLKLLEIYRDGEPEGGPSARRTIQAIADVLGVEVV